MRYSALSIFLALLLPSVCCAGAQTVGSPHQHQPTTPIIDGAVHPELIPDITAYRLYFLMVSPAPDATDADRARHAQRLRKINLSNGDNEALVTILTGFRAQYLTLVSTYNEQARDANARGEHPDLQGFKAERDQLVEATLASLRSTLTADGWDAVTSHIQAEKRNMKISAPGGVQ